MFTGHIPFQSYHLTKHDASDASFILEKILSGDEFNLDSSAWNHLDISAQAKSVIRGLLTLNPKNRLTIAKLSEHPWLIYGPVKSLKTTVCNTTNCQCNVPYSMDSDYPPTTNKNSTVTNQQESNNLNLNNKSSISSVLTTTSSFNDSSLSLSSTHLSGESIESDNKSKHRHTLKMKIKKKKCSKRKHLRKHEFEVEMNPIEQVDPVRIKKKDKKNKSKMLRPSYNSACDSGVHSLSSQYGITSGSSSTSSSGSIRPSISVGQQHDSNYNLLADSNNYSILSKSSSISSSSSSLSSSQMDTTVNRIVTNNTQDVAQLLPTKILVEHKLSQAYLEDGRQSAPVYSPHIDSTCEHKVTAYLATLNSERLLVQGDNTKQNTVIFDDDNIDAPKLVDNSKCVNASLQLLSCGISSTQPRGVRRNRSNTSTTTVQQQHQQTKRMLVTYRNDNDDVDNVPVFISSTIGKSTLLPSSTTSTSSSVSSTASRSTAAQRSPDTAFNFDRNNNAIMQCRGPHHHHPSHHHHHHHQPLQTLPCYSGYSGTESTTTLIQEQQKHPTHGKRTRRISTIVID